MGIPAIPRFSHRPPRRCHTAHRLSARWATLCGVLAILLLVPACTSSRTLSTGDSATGEASYYAKKFEGRLTANGERYDPQAMTAAHRTLPFGTQVRVTRLPYGPSVTVRINDRGPFVRGRIIDLSRTAAEQIGMIEDGVVDVRVEVLSGAGRAEVRQPLPKSDTSGGRVSW